MRFRRPASHRARALVDRSSDAVVVLDDRGLVTFANAAAESLGARVGRPATDLVDPDHRSLLLRTIAAAPAEEPVEFRLHDGERWAEARVSDLRGHVAVRGVVLAVRDVTERRRLTDAVTRSYLVEREAASRARALEEMRADLLAAVSHDFRTPLTSILGFGQMLRGHWDRLEESDRLDMLSRIVCAAEDLDRRVADFLEISRLDHVPAAVDAVPCELGELAAAAIARMQLALASHEVRVDVPEPATVLADPVAVARVLENLLGNAAKYAPAGTTVSVEIERLADTVRLTVGDEGPGIPEVDRERVFERFVRLGDRKVRGAGIGLSVVRQLVEAHGGRVSVGGDEESGSRFVVELPAAPSRQEVRA